MSDYRFQVTKHNDIDCLHVMIDGEDGETHIPLADIRASLHRAGIQLNLPSINRIKISAGTHFKAGSQNICIPGSFWQTVITDADTGQQLCFVKSIEIVGNAEGRNIVRLIVDEADFEIDYYIKQEHER